MTGTQIDNDAIMDSAMRALAAKAQDTARFLKLPLWDARERLIKAYDGLAAQQNKG